MTTNANVNVNVKANGSNKTKSAIKGVSNEVDKLDSKSNRLTTTQASAGRAFSQQARGLGGLVGAYAGAAASVFALQQAFAALQRATQSEEIVRGTITLANEIGSNGNKILAKIQEITKGQLTLAEAAQNANIALSAGFGGEQLERITGVALKASRALGRTLTDAFQRLVRGAAKLEPELLDELGIFTRIDPAVEKYARQLNVATSSLTNYEKRQAFINEVIEEGERKFSIINTVLPTTQQSLEELSAKVIDLATKVGQAVAGPLSSLADFFSQTPGNIGALAAVLSVQIFSSLSAGISSFVTESGQSIDRFFTRIEEKAKNIRLFGKNTIKDNLNTLDNTKAEFEGNKGFTGGKNAFGGKLSPSQFNNLIDNADSLTNQQIRETTPLIKAQIEQENKFIATKQKYLTVQGRTKEQIDAANRSIERATRRVKALEVSYINLNTVMNNSSGLSKGIARSADFIGAAFRRTGLAISAAVSLANKFFLVGSTIQFIASLFGVDILDSVIKFFKSLTEEIDRAKEGAQALAATTFISKNSNLEKLSKELDLDREAREKLAEKYSDVNKQIIEGLTNTSGIRQQFANQLAKDNGTNFAGRNEFRPNKEQFEQAQALSKEEVLRLGVLNQIERLNQTITRLKNKQTKLSGEELRSSRLEVATLEEAVKNLESGKTQLSGIIEEISRTAGIPIQQVADLALQGFIKFNDQVATIGFGGIQASISEISDKGLPKLKTGVGNLVSELGKSINASKSFSDSFASGSLDAERAAQKLTAITTITSELVKLQEAYTNEYGELDPKLVAIINRLKDQGKEARKITQELQAIEQLSVNITKAFSSQISLVDNLESSGIINLFNGKFAENGIEIAANKAENLVTAINIAKQGSIELAALQKEAASRGEKDLEQNAKIVALGNLRKTTEKALFGAFLKSKEEIQKIAIAEEKRLRESLQQLDIEKQKLEIQKLSNNILLSQEAYDNRNKALEALLTKENALLDISKAYNETQNIKFKKQQQINENKVEELNLANKLLDTELKGKELAIERAALLRDLRLQRTADNQANFPNFGTREDRRNLIAEQAASNLEKELNLINLRIEAEKKKFDNESRIINLEIDNLEAEKTFKAKDNSQKAALLLREKQISEQKSINEQKNLINRLDILDQEKIRADAELAIKKQEIDINKTNKLAALELEKTRLLTVQKEIQALTQFPIELARIFNEFIKTLAGFYGTSNPSLISVANFDEQIDSLNSSIKTSIEQLDSTINATKDLAATQADAATQEANTQDKLRSLKARAIQDEILDIGELAKLQAELNDIKISNLNRENAAELAALQIKIDNKRKEIGINEEEFKNTITQLENEQIKANSNHSLTMSNLREQGDALRLLSDDISSVLKNKIGTGIQDLSKAYFDGTLTMDNFKEGARDLFVGILDGIREKVTDRLIVKPVEDMIGSVFGDLFGSEERGNSRDLPLYTSDVSLGASKSIKSEVLSAAENSDKAVTETINKNKEQTTGFFDSVFGENGLLSRGLSSFGNTATKVFDFLGSSLSSALGSSGGSSSGFGSILGLIGTGISSMFGGGAGFTAGSNVGTSSALSVAQYGILDGRTMAAGGPVRYMAAGGPNLLRDSVPAMLEPGEFVMNKRASQDIGLNNLRNMNRGGSGGQPDVKVNIVNNGTAQQTDGQPQVSFDGKQFVIDVVLKDFRNNGPIRKGLRSV